MRFITLPLVALVACDATPEEQDPAQDLGDDVVLQFEATLGGARAACGTDVVLVDHTVQLADARAFLSGIELRNDSGTWVPMTLAADGIWQNGTVALLDFEDGSAGCADSGTSDLNDQVRGNIEAGTYDAVRFTLGVPFELNHNDSATAPAPLNTPGMFWTWQGGYKFLRVDFAVQTDPPSRWNVHVGSTGCDSAAPTEAPTVECTKPNRATVTVEGLDPLADTIELDLGALIAGVDVGTNTEDTPPGCMSSPTEPDDCAPVFGAIGLDFATGSCASDCDGQAVFQ